MSEQGKIEITADQRNLLLRCMQEFAANHISGLQDILVREFQYLAGLPAAFAELQQQMTKAHQQIISTEVKTVHGPICYVDNDLLPFLKRCILEVRRAQVARIQTLKKNATDLQIIANLDGQEAFFDTLSTVKWFQDTLPARLPRLTDYVTLKRAEEIIALRPPGLPQQQATLPAKPYDVRNLISALEC